MRRLWRALGRESGEQSAFIKLIIVEKAGKAGLVLLAVAALLWLGHRGTLYEWALEAQDQLIVTPRLGLIHYWLDRLLVSLGFQSHLVRYLLMAVLYAAIELTEGIGLYLRRRWAEYMVALATGIFVPVEMEAVIGHPSLLKAAMLAFNIAVVVYLVWAKKLYRLEPEQRAA